MSSIQWLPKPSRHEQGSYTDIECKQVTFGLLGVNKLVYDHQNTGRRTGTHLKIRHCDISVSSFVVQFTTVAVSLYVALTRKAKVMVAELTGYTAANVDAPYERKLSVLRTCSFPDQ